MREFNTRVAKGDYSITFETDDRKAYEQVQSLCRLLVDGKDGDAIPIEWILKWACKFIDPNSEGYKMAMELVHDWRKENEQIRNDN